MANPDSQVEGEVSDEHEGEFEQGELGVGDVAEGEAAGCELGSWASP